MPRTIGRIRNPPFVVILIALALGGRPNSDSPVFISDIGEYPDRKLNPQQALELRKELDEYASSSKLQVLRDGDPDEVRFWVSWATFDPHTIGYETLGHILSGKGALICRIKYPPTNRSPFIGSCRSDKRASIPTPLAPLIQELAQYSDQELQCGVVDGYWLVIEGVSAGRRFALESTNPDSCRDDGSKLVSRVITEIFGKSR